MTLTTNPYIGPRTFSQAEANRFFGRDREARELLSLVISQRLVLFYAQSGAGKSSLLNARLIPTLRAEGFQVLPVGRVGGALAAESAPVKNVFVYNLLDSIETKAAATTLADLDLRTFLAGLTSDDGGATWYYDAAATDDASASAGDYVTPATVLLVDQFEEIVTNFPERWEDRADFFRQLDAALAADPKLWIVLTLREDYVAALDPYLPLVERWVRGRYYMQRMGVKAALDAVREPAQLAGRTFAPGVAEWLVDNLRLVRAQGSEGALVPGEFVEPVQLQVVCYQWWESLPAGVTTIELDYVAQMVKGNEVATFVDQALADFYERVLAEVLALHRGAVTEQELRAWFSSELITEAGTRGLVYQAQARTGSLPNALVRDLEARFLVRAVARAGGVWYELVHDRFVQPILWANQARQTPLRAHAEAWAAAGRNSQKLYGGQQLWEASTLLETQPEALSPLEREFIAAGVAEEQRRQRELEQAQALAVEQRHRAEEQAAFAREQAAKTAMLRRRNQWFAGALAVAILLLVAAVFFYMQSGQNAGQAHSAAATAEANAVEADQNAQRAGHAEATAQANAQMALANAQMAQQAEATAQANADLANQQLAALAGEQLLAQAREYKKDLDVTNAISSFQAAAAYPKLGLDLSDEISDTRRFVATTWVQQGEALLREAKASGVEGVQQQGYISATALFSQALALNPPPDTQMYVWIEPGEFVMGSTKEQSAQAVAECNDRYGAGACDANLYDNETPTHTVKLDGYWLLRTEVTNEQYKRCVDADVCEPPYSLSWDKSRSARLPVTAVNWEQAQTYAAWVGGRLPTEAEWEKACRGMDERIYPWGDAEATAELGNFEYNVGYTTDVGAYPPGANGLYDMAGNVWEWTADWYAGDYYASSPPVNPPGPATGDGRVVRGGAFRDDQRDVRCAARYWRDPYDSPNGVGFRVVLSPFSTSDR